MRPRDRVQQVNTTLAQGDVTLESVEIDTPDFGPSASISGRRNTGGTRA